MDYHGVMLDLILASAHHVLIFAIFGTLFGEMVALNGPLNAAMLKRVARLDAIYGISAALVVIVGFSRAVFAAKGWSYYSHNGFFWAKIATFALIGLISIKPTMAFLRWKASGTLPDQAALRGVRQLLHIELTLFVLLPIFAAAMARGYAEF
jgi:putative membrane protein